MRNSFMRLMRTVTLLCASASTFLALSLHAYAAEAGKLSNPLSSDFDTIPKFISGVLKVLVMVSLPIITLFIVIAGFKFIWAQGNQGELTKAKQNLVYVLLGALFILGAWIVATLIAATVTQLTGTGY